MKVSPCWYETLNSITLLVRYRVQDIGEEEVGKRVPRRSSGAFIPGRAGLTAYDAYDACRPQVQAFCGACTVWIYLCGAAEREITGK